MYKKLKVSRIFSLIFIIGTVFAAIPSAYADFGVKPWTMAIFGGIASGSPSDGLVGFGIYRRFKAKLELGIDVIELSSDQTVTQTGVVFNYYLNDGRFSAFVGGEAGKNFSGTQPFIVGPQAGFDYHLNEDLSFGARAQYLLGTKMLYEIIGAKIYFKAQ